jgi:hypothetical protein
MGILITFPIDFRLESWVIIGEWRTIFERDYLYRFTCVWIDIFWGRKLIDATCLYLLFLFGNISARRYVFGGFGFSWLIRSFGSSFRVRRSFDSCNLRVSRILREGRA